MADGVQKRFCVTCQKMRDELGGRFKKTKKSPVWRCAICWEKTLDGTGQNKPKL